MLVLDNGHPPNKISIVFSFLLNPSSGLFDQVLSSQLQITVAAFCIKLFMISFIYKDYIQDKSSLPLKAATLMKQLVQDCQMHFLVFHLHVYFHLTHMICNSPPSHTSLEDAACWTLSMALTQVPLSLSLFLSLHTSLHVTVCCDSSQGFKGQAGDKVSLGRCIINSRRLNITND